MTFGRFAWGEQPWGFVEPGEGALETLFQASDGFSTRATDTPSSVYLPERVNEPFSYSRSLLAGGEALGGIVTQGLGAIVLENSDGFYDGTFRNFAVDGREIRIKLGESGIVFSDFTLVWRGSIAGWAPDEREVRIELRDLSFRLDRTMQTAFYAGTGGLEGGEDVAGKPKPICFGSPDNVTPVWLGKVDLGDGLLDTFQVNFRHIQDVTAVREAGLAYTKITSGAPAGGEYKVHASDGVFQTGATPLDRITCDVEGDAGAGGDDYVDTTAPVVERMLTEFSAGFGPESLDLDSFDALAAAAPGEIGVFFDAEEVNLSEAAGRVLAGVAAWGGFNRSGLFEARQIARPASEPEAVFGGADIIEAPRLLGSGDLPAELAIPTWRTRVGYRRNWTLQRDTIREGASDAAREFAQQEWRVAEATNTVTRARHLLASEPALLESFLKDKADAEALAAHLITLFSGETRFIEVVVRTNFFVLDIGSTVRLEYPRFGLRQGRNGVIVAQDLSAAERSARYTLFMPGAV